MRKFVEIIDKGFRVFFYISGAWLFAMFFVCAYSVFMRAVGEPSIWADELIRFLMVFMSFMGAPYLISIKGDLLVDLTEIFVGKNRKLLRVNHIIGDFLLLAIIIYLIIPTLNLALQNMDTRTSAMQWTLGYVYMIMPVGFFLCAIAQIKNIIKSDILGIKNRDAFIPERK